MRPPPGYPFVGELPSRPPPGPRDERGLRDRHEREPIDWTRRGVPEPKRSPTSSFGPAFVLAFAGAMMGAGFMVVALVSAEARHAALLAATPREMSSFDLGSSEDPGQTANATAEPTDNAAGPAESSPWTGADSPPPAITRNVPVHPVRFLEGCSSGDLEKIEEVLASAIGTGAPLYNEGDVAGCADAYERGARDLEAALPASCPGPARALAEGQAAAAKVGHPTGRAWALRDAFDGLIEVLDRSRSGGVGSL